MEANQTLILVNPKAREGRGKRWADSCDSLKSQICDALGESSAQLALTTQEDHGSGIVRKALLSGTKRVIVVGGDGTLSEAIQGFFDGDRLIQPEAILMVLPGGRGDDFFKTMANQRFFRSGTAWKKGMDLLSNGTPTSVDVGKIRWLGPEGKQRYFINVASIGFAGLVMERVQSQKGLKKSLIGKSSWTYGLQGALSLKDYKPVNVVVSVDDQRFYEGPLHLGLILNGRYNTGGICWDPRTRLDDGFFHVLVMEPRNFLTTLKNTSKILMELPDRVVGAHRTLGRKVRVVLKAGAIKPHRLFEVDGDLFEETETRGAEFEIIPGAIRFQTWNKLK